MSAIELSIVLPAHNEVSLLGSTITEPCHRLRAAEYLL